ncbi:MAG: PSD1 and planctomycete cytochrome C domain-containing protein [Phycisphaerales bacterium]|nr:PSD1 and planctomycete cytochrome C domain-containing protein [Phycisphaerales bacterium]
MKGSSQQSMCVVAMALWLSCPAVAAEEIRYGRDVRPILSDRCFLCHGPDRAQQQAGLRLDSFEASTEMRRAGAAIVPGDPDASLLWQRLTASHPDDVMPPLDSGRPQLSEAERHLVFQWIKQGAAYEDHWSMQSLVAPAVPEIDDPWIRNEIDQFVLAHLRKNGLQPSPEADRATLARRLYLDLTGLAPTPGEIDAYVSDESPDAYEQLVEQLLTEEPYATRHAERMATPWLDLARFADTSGIHMDAGRTIWPYRDWVLRAYKDNKPFDEFVVEQLAGDLLPDRTSEQLVASGFNRCHVTTDEGGSINDEALFEYAVERTNTLGSVFLGLTINCAQCHDHKFDPVSMEDYYGLLAFFNNNEEPGLYNQSPNPNRALEPSYTITTAGDQERIDALTTRLQELEAKRDAPDPLEDEQIAASEADVRDDGWRWSLPPVLAAVSSNGSVLEIQDDGSVLATSEAPTDDDYTILLETDRTDLRAIALDVLQHESMPQGRAGRAPNGNAVLSGITVEVISRNDPAQRRDVELAWAWADIEQPNADFRVVNALRPDDGRVWAINAHQDPDDRVALFLAAAPFGYEGGSTVVVTLNFHSVYAQHSFGNVRLHLGSVGEPALARLPLAHTNWYITGPFSPGTSQESYDTAFGPEEAGPLDFTRAYEGQAWRYAPLVLEGQNVALAQGVGAEYIAREFYAPGPRTVELSLGSDDGILVYLDGSLVHENRIDRGVAADQDRITIDLPTGRSTYVTKIVNTGGPAAMYYKETIPAGELAPDMLAWALPDAAGERLAERARLAWRTSHSPRWLELTETIDSTTKERDEYQDTLPMTMVMQERSEVRPTHVMMRGLYDAPDEERGVARAIPVAIGSLDVEGTPTRIDLARWLVGDENPLTARVTANRMWAMFFGQGLSETVEDFGFQGSWPSHPVLLDWLAASFRDRGWDVRDSIRTIVHSSTYRQSSEGAAPVDATLYARYPRQRLTAEQIRDQALHVSGLLVERFGGPSVKPYQPLGLWSEVAMPQSNTRVFERDSGDSLWRRSLYTYWKRAAPPPAMLTLDAPTREYCATRRLTTNTPLQALVLWNDEQFVEAARATAARVLVETPEPDRIVDLYRRCTGTRPSKEITILMQDTLARFTERYRGDEDAAQALVMIGDSSMPEGMAMDELAAWTMLANAVLSSDAAIVKD